MPAAPLSLLGGTAGVDAAAVQVAVAVALAIVAVVVAAVAVRVGVAVVAATVVAAMVVVVAAAAAAGFVVRAAVASPTLHGWIRSNCCWPSAQLREEDVEPSGERAQSGE